VAAKKQTKKASTDFTFPRAAKPRTKGEIEKQLAEALEIPRKDVSRVFQALNSMIAQDANRLGTFTLPGIGKVTVARKPATKARKGINPFTGEPTIFKAKPARKVVKIRALKNLKDAVN
jgi:nucleoid DNA-binding protein